MRQTLWALIVVLASVAAAFPIANADTGAGTAELLDCNASNQDILVNNLVNPSLTPNTHVCANPDGGCVASESTKLSVNGYAWYVVFISGFDIDASVDVTTKIECSGHLSAGTVNWGGIGSRLVIVDIPPEGGNTLTNSSQRTAIEQMGDETAMCGYTAPLGACETTPLSSPWHFTKFVNGRVKDGAAVQGCGDVRIRNSEGTDIPIDPFGDLPATIVNVCKTISVTHK